MILPGADLEAAASVAERIRLAVEGLRIRSRLGDPEATLTISGGVAISESPHANWDGTLRVADFALYEAKSTGRNRIYSATRAAMEEAMVLETEGDSSAVRRAWHRHHDRSLQVDEGSIPI